MEYLLSRSLPAHSIVRAVTVVPLVVWRVMPVHADASCTDNNATVMAVHNNNRFMLTSFFFNNVCVCKYNHQIAQRQMFRADFTYNYTLFYSYNYSFPPAILFHQLFFSTICSLFHLFSASTTTPPYFRCMPLNVMLDIEAPGMKICWEKCNLNDESSCFCSQSCVIYGKMLYICIHKKVCEYGLTAMSLLPNLFV